MNDFKISPSVDGADPVFEHPWQAQAFSLVVAMNRAGHFAWKDWAQVFSDVIKELPALPDESPLDTYYRQWACALEKMTFKLGVVVEGEIAQREREWHQAFLNTPHGMAVNLINAACPPHPARIKHPIGKPLAVAAAGKGVG